MMSTGPLPISAQSTAREPLRRELPLEGHKVGPVTSRERKTTSVRPSWTNAYCVFTSTVLVAPVPSFPPMAKTFAFKRTIE